MAVAYSMDLRTRVLKDSDDGLSSKELAMRDDAARHHLQHLETQVRIHRRRSSILSSTAVLPMRGCGGRRGGGVLGQPGSAS